MKRSRFYKHRKWHRIILILVFLLSSGSAGRTTPVQAAPGADGLIIYRMKIFMPPDPLCVGKDYSIKVRISADLQYEGEDGRYHDLISEGINGRKIEASVRDNNIAGISPRSLLTGWDIDSVGPGEVEFRLKAKKAGNTVLFFETYIQEAAQSLQEPYFGSSVPIKVVNCRYKVTAFTNASASYPNLRSYIISRTSGEMKSSDGRSFSGTTGVNWQAFSYSAMCSHSHTFLPAQAQLNGTLNQDQLTVQVTFDAASFSSQNCASSNSGQLLAPPLIVTVPVSGGGKHWTYSLPWGMEALEGSVSIYVTPIADR